MVDTRMLKEKQKFKELRDSFVIFITQLDYLGESLPLYHINRVIEETGQKVNDGSHIIYVNGSYKGNDAIGRLMHDFACKDADDIHYEALRKGVRHFKEEGGRGIVCKAVEEYGREQARESALNTKLEMIRNLMESMKLSAQQIMDGMRLSSEEQEIILSRLK